MNILIPGSYFVGGNGISYETIINNNNNSPLWRKGKTLGVRNAGSWMGAEFLFVPEWKQSYTETLNFGGL